MSKNLFLLVLCLGLCWTYPQSGWGIETFEGLGQSFESMEDDFQGTMVGSGALLSTSPYDGGEEELLIVPIVIGRYKRLYVEGASAGLVLNNSKALELSLVVEPRMMGYGSEDSAMLAGMKDREWSVDGGLKLKWMNKIVDFSLIGLTDLLDRHEGHEGRAMFSKEFFNGFLTPRGGIKWQSKEMTDYYYGVKLDERRATRQEYEPDYALNYFGGMSVGIPLGSHWAIIGDVAYENLSHEIKDSPIVNEDYLYSYLAGAVYRF